MQRFISEDPLGFGGGDTNLYAYVGNDPINATDPSGLWSVGICIGGMAGYGIAGSIDDCLVFTSSGNIGITQTAGALGEAGVIAAASVGFQASNANNVSELGGPFATAGGTIGFLRGVGNDTFAGRKDGRLIYGDEGHYTVGAWGMGMDGLPIREFHGGVTNTWAFSFRDATARGMAALGKFGLPWTYPTYGSP